MSGKNQIINNLLAQKNSYCLKLSQDIIHRLFSQMSLGQLTIYLPDGSTLFYGNKEDTTVVANIFLKRYDFFKRCVLFGDIGFGESYVDGDWDTDSITKVIEWMILNVEKHPTLMSDETKNTPVNFFKFVNKLQHVLRANTVKGSQKNIFEHYDLGNTFFKTFLDPTMTYSSAYFLKGSETLEEAQRQKNDQFCRKLLLRPSDHILEIGSGWGGFALHAAKNYGCKVTTITISKEQFAYAKELFQKERVNDRVEIKLIDYREMTGQFDKIVSIEMIEAVGDKFLQKYFDQCHKLLKKDGLLGLQMILAPDNRYDSFKENVDWIQKHVFPGSLLPSFFAIKSSIRTSGTLGLHDYDDITPSYVKTLATWRDNFNAKVEEVKALGFKDEFIRKWNYYLSYCEAAFHMRNISVVQAIFTRPNNRLLAGITK